MSASPAASLAAASLAAAVVLLGAPEAARAQADPSAPRVGETVRIRSRLIDRRGYRVECEGRLASVVGDTLVLESSRAAKACPQQVYPADAVQRVHVARGSRGSRIGHAALGLLIGAAGGAAFGRAVAGDGCNVGGCDDGDLAVAILTFVGAAGGGTVGVVVGALIPAGPRWVPVGGAPPVRVASGATGIGVRIGF